MTQGGQMDGQMSLLCAAHLASARDASIVAGLPCEAIYAAGGALEYPRQRGRANKTAGAGAGPESGRAARSSGGQAGGAWHSCECRTRLRSSRRWARFTRNCLPDAPVSKLRAAWPCYYKLGDDLPLRRMGRATGTGLPQLRECSSSGHPKARASNAQAAKCIEHRLYTKASLNYGTFKQRSALFSQCATCGRTRGTRTFGTARARSHTCHHSARRAPAPA